MVSLVDQPFILSKLLFNRYVAEVFEYVNKHKNKVSGYRITWAPAVLRHFSAHLEPISPVEKKAEKEEFKEEMADMEEVSSRMRKRSLHKQASFM